VSPDPVRLVAFLSGTASVGPRSQTRWWLDAEVQHRLQLTADQVEALDQIYTEASGPDLTQMLWRMYQTLSPPQRRQFSRLLEVRRPNGGEPSPTA
jgi:hypothetical protein